MLAEMRRGVILMTDEQLLISTVRKAGRIISEYLEPGSRDSAEILNRLIAVLDTEDVARAIERLEKRYGLPVVK
jgi:hypothetical protein